MITGTVKFFDDKKGFGFIRPDNSDRDIFVHFSGIAKTGNGRRTLTDKARVTFDIEEGKNGYQASNVSVVKK